MLLLNALCLCSFAGTRRALVIGIGEYEDPAWGQIHGDRDAGAVAGMLRENGFRNLSVLVLSSPVSASVFMRDNAVDAYMNYISRPVEELAFSSCYEYFEYEKKSEPEAVASAVKVKSS